MLIPPHSHGPGSNRPHPLIPDSRAAASTYVGRVPPRLSEPFEAIAADGLIGSGAELAPGAGGFATVLRALLNAAGGDPESRGNIEAHLQDLLLRNAAYARSHARSERDDHYAERLQLLEDRVHQLRDDLELSNLRLAEERQKGAGGIESEYRTVQGIAPDDVHRVRKRTLIQDLFRANVALAQELETKFGTNGASLGSPPSAP